jgi:hypothetical protein
MKRAAGAPSTRSWSKLFEPSESIAQTQAIKNPPGIIFTHNEMIHEIVFVINEITEDTEFPSVGDRNFHFE